MIADPNLVLSAAPHQNDACLPALPGSTLPFLNSVETGDCLELMPLLPDQCVDMILCDLPYGCTARNEWDRIIPMEALWAQYRRVIKPNGAIVLTGQGLFSARLMLAAEDLYKYTLIWRKNKPRGHLNAKKQPLRNHEDVLVFYRKQPTYNPQMTRGHEPMHAATNRSDSKNYGKTKVSTNNGGSTVRYPQSVLDFAVLNNDDPLRVHPTQKPVALAEYLIRTYTNEGDVVLDNACRSGALLAAAKRLGRQFVGMEANPMFASHAQTWIATTEPIEQPLTILDDDSEEQMAA